MVIRGHHVGDRHSRSDAVPWRGKQRDLRLSEAGEPPQAAARLSGFDVSDDQTPNFAFPAPVTASGQTSLLYNRFLTRFSDLQNF